GEDPERSDGGQEQKCSCDPEGECVMKRILTTLAAGTVALGLGIGVPGSAQAFAPAVAAAIAGGAVLGGTALGAGAAATYPGYYGPGYRYAPYAEVAPGSSVEVLPSCYITHRWIGGVSHRVRVCD